MISCTGCGSVELTVTRTVVNESQAFIVVGHGGHGIHPLGTRLLNPETWARVVEVGEDREMQMYSGGRSQTQRHAETPRSPVL